MKITRSIVAALLAVCAVPLFAQMSQAQGFCNSFYNRPYFGFRRLRCYDERRVMGFEATHPYWDMRHPWMAGYMRNHPIQAMNRWGI